MALANPLSVGTTPLSRALAYSIAAHAVIAIVLVVTAGKSAEHSAPELVDIELAPPAPPVEALPAETAKPIDEGAEPHMMTKLDEPDVGDEPVAHDAGVDAPPMALAVGSGSGSDNGSAAMGSAVGVAAATTLGSGGSDAIAATDDAPAVEGAPTSPGTAANLLAYMPPGHVLAVLVRFDRLRGTEWAQRTEDLFRHMPDYGGLFGTRDADIADKLDTLAISTPQPKSAIATTLVMRTSLGRPAIRDLLGSGVQWSTATGGMLGTRIGPGFPGDQRVLLSPWRDWYVLAQPADLGTLATKAGGDLDTREVGAKTPLPAWLAQIRSIEHESGDDAKTGPALVLTSSGAPLGTAPSRTGRYKLPELGLGVSSLPVPARVSLAMELVQQGWLVRGNISFASEADATEFAAALATAQHRLVLIDQLSHVLKNNHVLGLIQNLSVSRAGPRISYATSISIADGRAVLTAARMLLQ
ncbi:MAG TPA: hypothetical protein VGG28_20795 [Kofleriaceae bacterium]